MGNGPDVPAAESMASVLNAYSQYLPGLIQKTAAQQPAIAGSQLQATQATQPTYNQLNLDQARQFAVPLAQVGQDVQRSNALAGGQTNLASLIGPGGQSAMAAYDLSRATNPNYYNVQDAASKGAADLLGNIKLGGLSGGEQAAVERSLAQSNTGTGNTALLNPLNTVSNALNFGGAYNSKLGLMGNALGAANQTATSAQNTGFSPVSIALGQPNTSTMGNFGTGTFSGTNAGTQNASASNAFNFGNSMLGGMQGSNNAAIGANAQLASAYTPSAIMGSLPSYS